MSVGKIKEFDMSERNWRAYGDRMEMYFKANAVKEELKLLILIASMGDAAYELLSDLASPKKPSALEYELVMEMMLNHLDPKPSLLAERYRFRQPAALEGAERDAAAVEPAAASGKMVGGYAPTSVAAIRQSETICSVRGSCLSCGGFGHRAVECKFRTYQCSQCGKVGHLRRVCPQKGAAMASGVRSGSVRGRGQGSGQARGGLSSARGIGRGAYDKWQTVSAGQRREDARSNWLVKDEREGDEGDEMEQFCHNLSLSHYKPLSVENGPQAARTPWSGTGLGPPPGLVEATRGDDSQE
ncbi:Uncharacterized protein OBRU01_25059 [Operophtera brumata]|uniref:CCHC-type domain-containing protein n=1 Tax=Operophtera brumata TaxID=104452 RepID=A0A0L7KEM7_OPEBR|nr:Uncharacterized protein OBRU01_25059 [Operophtera brumata]